MQKDLFIHTKRHYNIIMIGIWKPGFKSQCHPPLTSYVTLSKSPSLLFFICLMWMMIPHRMVVKIK